MKKKSIKSKVIVPLLAVALSVGGFVGIEAASSTKIAKKENVKEIITPAEAEKIALKEVKGQVIKVELDDVNDLDAEYEVDIVQEGIKHEFEIQAYTGKITDYEIDKDFVSDLETKPLEAGKKVIGQAKAKKIALELVNGEITKFKLDEDDNKKEYEIEIVKNNKKYEIEIDAYTGQVTDFEMDDDYLDKSATKPAETGKSLIGEAKAKKIALELVNGQIIKFELDEDDDDDEEYEIEIVKNNKKYEIAIHAYSGKVLEFELDDDDFDNDDIYKEDNDDYDNDEDDDEDHDDDNDEDDDEDDDDEDDDDNEEDED